MKADSNRILFCILGLLYCITEASTFGLLVTLIFFSI